MATWDQMSAGTWDQLFTWDEPDRNIAIDAAYALGEITVDAPELTVDWSGDTPTDLLSPSLARDEFPVNTIATDSFTRSVSSGVGATDQGTQYTTANGSASDYNVNGSVLTISNGSLAVQRRVLLASLSAFHSDFTITSRISTAVTGAGGNAEVALRTRFVDTSNFTDIRVFRNVTTNNVTVAVRQFVTAVETVSSFATVPNASLTSSITLRIVTRGNILYGWAWVEGTTPPVAPSVTLTGVTWLTAGSFELYSRLNSFVTNSLPVTMSFDNLTIVDDDLLVTSIGAHGWAGGTGTTKNFFSLDTGLALFRPEATNTVYLMLVNDIAEVDFDVTLKVRATTLITGARAAILIVARYQDSSNYLRIRLDFNTDQIMGWGFEQVVGGSASTVSSGLFSDLFHTVDGWIRFRAQGMGPTLRLKAWADDDRINRDWTAYTTDTAFPSTPGKCGFGGYLLGGNTNTLPYTDFQFDQYWQGANGALDAGQISVGLSLDDGLPSTVTNTQNIGVNEAAAELLGPIEVSPDVFFSNFRADQPFADLDRDTAGVAITAQVLTTDGVRSVRVFTGRMSDIPLDDQSAKLTAISSARLGLSAPIQPPAVHGYYEGKEATWLIGYILFQAQLYVAPRPLDGCRLYIPLNGTTHPYIPSTNSGAAALSGVNYGSLNQAAFGPPRWMDGPFTAAPDLVLNETAVRKLQSGPGTLAYPGGFAPGDDFLSQTANKGRIEAWVKGDSTNVVSSMNPSQGDLVNIKVRNPSGSRYAAFIITSSRQVRGQISDGVASVFYPLMDLPNDGLWHFVSFSWNLKPFTGTCTITLDNKSTTYNHSLTTSNLAVTDDIDRAEFDISIPTVEIRFTTGDTAAKAGYANQINFSPDALMRRSLLQLEAVAESSPREAFELLSSLAQAELAQVGFDEQDRLLYLPLSYWGEKEQQIVGESLSTDSNLGKQFKATQAVRKIFNQITLSYKQTYVNETWITGFQTSQLVRLDPGQSVDMMAALSAPAIEMRGLTLAVMSGSALAATPPSVSNAINYLTMNTAQDGTGTYATTSDVLGQIISWTPGSITVRLQNNSPNTFYLSNNVSIPPLGVAIKQVVVADAVVDAVNADSVAARGIRNLPVSLPAIQSPANAGTIAAALAGFLAFPRTSIISDVWGDFRRKPGSLVWVSDLDNTGLSDSFRLTGITTVQDGSDVQQVISAVQAWRVQDWGSGSWGSGIWGES